MGRLAVFLLTLSMLGAGSDEQASDSSATAVRQAADLTKALQGAKVKRDGEAFRLISKQPIEFGSTPEKQSFKVDVQIGVIEDKPLYASLLLDADATSAADIDALVRSLPKASVIDGVKVQGCASGSTKRCVKTCKKPDGSEGCCLWQCTKPITASPVG